jgi:hypothetical protein
MSVDKTGDGRGEPGVHWYAVSPSNSNDLDPIPRGLYVGVTGNLSLTDIDGTVVTFVAAPVGYHPLRPRRVRATGTTATNIVAIY